MSMTPASSDYFRQNAQNWDQISASYFTDAIRAAAIRKAYLRPEMTVADVGAGTGYLAAGLAPLVKQVYVLDGSPEMLDVARRNLSAWDNIIYKPAEGLALPLEDASVDAVFANMYLHHLPDPLAGIREMRRILRPGGRMIITDMDSHPYEWFKEEMTDVWLGFERAQVQEWFEAAGLVNVIVGSSGESCEATSLAPEQRQKDERQVRISVFLAAGTRRVPGVREAVQAGYGAAAVGGGGCCTPADSAEGGAACCGGAATDLIALDLPLSNEIPTPASEVDPVNWVTGYTPTELSAAPQEAAEFSLGCGNPTAMAGLRPGETVLDIGSGGGLDAFIAAQQVGPSGRVIGVDMTPEMLARARAAAEKAGIANVEFRQGQAEALPVDDESVDVIVSNCVINLTEDKGRVFREAYRALKPGGRIEVSDMVTDGSFLPLQAGEAANYSGCVFGALPEGEYTDLVSAAGFRDVNASRSASQGATAGVHIYSIHLTAWK